MACERVQGAIARFLCVNRRFQGRSRVLRRDNGRAIHTLLARRSPSTTTTTAMRTRSGRRRVEVGRERMNTVSRLVSERGSSGVQSDENGGPPTGEGASGSLLALHVAFPMQASAPLLSPTRSGAPPTEPNQPLLHAHTPPRCLSSHSHPRRSLYWYFKLPANGCRSSISLQVVLFTCCHTEIHTTLELLQLDFAELPSVPERLHSDGGD